MDTKESKARTPQIFLHPFSWQDYLQQPKVETTQASISGLIDKIRYVYTVEYCLALTRKEILTRYSLDDPRELVVKHHKTNTV